MDNGMNPSQEEDYDHGEEEENMDDNKKPNQSEDNGMKLNQEEEQDVKHNQGDDNDANPNQEVDWTSGVDKERMRGACMMKNPTLPEDGNDHVTTMKPLATLQKHKAVCEKTDLAYRQSAERTQRKPSHLGQPQMCSVYPASLFRWLAKHTTCTIFAVLLGSLLDVIVHAIWSHSLAAIVDS